jgi:hypothetical protein
MNARLRCPSVRLQPHSCHIIAQASIVIALLRAGIATRHQRRRVPVVDLQPLVGVDDSPIRLLRHVMDRRSIGVGRAKLRVQRDGGVKVLKRPT